MENAFYLMLKVYFVLKIFKYLSWLFWSCGKPLIRKLRLISKFVTSHSGQQIITIHILPDISSSKDNHAMKFGQ